MRGLRTAALAVLLPLAACGGEGSVPGPGTLTATLVSPNGAEGAALVEFFGDGIGAVSAVDGPLWQRSRGDTIRVFIVSETGGTLRFAVEVADTTRKPKGVVLEVSDPADEVRTSLSGYALEFRR